MEDSGAKKQALLKQQLSKNCYVYKKTEIGKQQKLLMMLQSEIKHLVQISLIEYTPQSQCSYL